MQKSGAKQQSVLRQRGLHLNLAIITIVTSVTLPPPRINDKAPTSINRAKL